MEARGAHFCKNFVAYHSNSIKHFLFWKENKKLATLSSRLHARHNGELNGLKTSQ